MSKKAPTVGNVAKQFVSNAKDYFDKHHASIPTDIVVLFNELESVVTLLPRAHVVNVRTKKHTTDANAFRKANKAGFKAG